MAGPRMAPPPNRHSAPLLRHQKPAVVPLGDAGRIRRDPSSSRKLAVARLQLTRFSRTCWVRESGHFNVFAPNQHIPAPSFAQPRALPGQPARPSRKPRGISLIGTVVAFKRPPSLPAHPMEANVLATKACTASGVIDGIPVTLTFFPDTGILRITDTSGRRIRETWWYASWRSLIATFGELTQHSVGH
jgi:hypothetical protein